MGVAAWAAKRVVFLPISRCRIPQAPLPSHTTRLHVGVTPLAVFVVCVMLACQSEVFARLLCVVRG